MEDKVRQKLLTMFEAGELVPVTRIEMLKHLSPSARCRLALQGRFPSLRVGRRILTHPDLVREGLSTQVISERPNDPTKQARKKKTPDNRGAEIAAARARLRSRGLQA